MVNDFNNKLLKKHNREQEVPQHKVRVYPSNTTGENTIKSTNTQIGGKT